MGDIVVNKPTDNELRDAADLKRAAALNETDIVALRCFKAGAAFPEAWKSYTQALYDLGKETNPKKLVWPTRPSTPYEI